ncbi:hypothetical protein GCM10009733_047330 [Nonomuraea maheshkhaliensis]|uniref:Uncharacterized protein n=1 Tax=Nonomuraea maheshkhaliensis TaxID=419590 RepID=A0ABN2FFM9_9ACTN
MWRAGSAIRGEMWEPVVEAHGPRRRRAATRVGGAACAQARAGDETTGDETAGDGSRFVAAWVTGGKA